MQRNTLVKNIPTNAPPIKIRNQTAESPSQGGFTTTRASRQQQELSLTYLQTNLTQGWFGMTGIIIGKII